MLEVNNIELRPVRIVKSINENIDISFISL